MPYTLDIIDHNDGRDWHAVIYLGESQVWCSSARRTKREAREVGEQVLREIEHRDS